MPEPGWAQILTAIYRQGKSITAPHDLSTLSREHLLVDKTDIRPEEVEKSLVFLREQNLISMKSASSPSEEPEERLIRLSPDGFEVAHQRDLNYQEKSSNRAIVALTLILGLAAIMDAVISWTTAELVGREFLALGALILIETFVFIIVLYELKQAGAVQLEDLKSRRRRRFR